MSDTATPVFKRRTREFLVVPVPRWLQYDPERPFHFGLLLNLFFGFASTMVVCNLYYCQPLLLQLAASFGVDNTRVANVPTLTQAGYASGILLISPLGDLVRRRPLLLALVACSTLLTLGLARAPNLEAFSALTFLIGLASVTPQVLIPLAADLAPPPRRAQAVAIVFSGILLGLMVARVLAGIIAQYTGPGFDGWRNVYWMAFGVQALTLVMLYLSLPDWPTKNKGTGLTYWGIMRTMARLAFTEPLLIQCSLIAFLSFSVFASFWVTLTFLLGGEPYHYSTLQIGLFGLIGALGVLTAPLVGRLIDRLRSPWYATLASVGTLLVFAGIMEGAGGVSVGAVVVVVFGLDVGFQLQQISNATRIYSYVFIVRLFWRALVAVCVLACLERCCLPVAPYWCSFRREQMLACGSATLVLVSLSMTLGCAARARAIRRSVSRLRMLVLGSRRMTLGSAAGSRNQTLMRGSHTLVLGSHTLVFELSDASRASKA